MNTHAPAMVSSRQKPTQSMSTGEGNMTCWRESSRSIASMRRLMRPARSKSSSAAASRISSSSSETNPDLWPRRKRSTCSTFLAYSSGVMAPQQTPGPLPTWLSKHGRPFSAQMSGTMSASSGCACTSLRTRFHSAQVATQSGVTERTASIVCLAERASV